MMKRRLAIISVFLLTACNGPAPEESSSLAHSTVPSPTSTARTGPAPQTTVAVRRGLAAVTAWALQLQNIDFGELRAAPFDLVVIEPYRDETARWSSVDIAALKASGKIVLAYLSIGEAEDYRPYWQTEWDADRDGQPDPGAPAWLDVVNPDWPGNYKVHYWDEGWQAVIAPYLDAIVQDGYDGVYLDIVDGYWYYFERGRASAPKEMADFVSALAERARAVNPGFYVFPQNASGILNDLGGDQAAVDKYLAHINGLGAEDTFFRSGNVDENGPLNPDEYTLEQLDRFHAAGKVILSIDYVTNPGKVAEFFRLAREHGFMPYAGVRALDRVVINEP